MAQQEQQPSTENRNTGILIVGFVFILTGLIFLTEVGNTVAGALLNTNVTGASSTAIQLIPLFFAISLICGGTAMVVLTIRNMYSA